MDAYIVPIGDASLPKAIEILQELRASVINTDMDLMGRNLSKTMKYTDSLNVKFVIILGSKEIEKGAATVRDMKSGEQTEVKLDQLKNFIKN